MSQKVTQRKGRLMNYEKRLAKIFCSFAAVGAAIFLISGCGSKKTGAVDTIKDKGTLVVGTSADYAPFEFPIVKDGKKEIVGYDMMVAQKIADDMGVKLKIVNTEFPSLISELKNKKIDLIMAGMVSTPERRKVIAFSKPYYKVYNVVLVQKKDAKNFPTKASLAGKQIGVQQSTTQEEIAKKQLKASKLVAESQLTSLTTELKEGKLSGVVCEKAIADNYLATYPDKYAVAEVKLVTPEENKNIDIGIRKDDKDLKKRVDKVLTKLEKSGQLDEMFKKAQKIQAENK